jgi:ATP-dependent DNA helicase Q4
MACFVADRVTVLVNVATAGKLQALSHTRGIDYGLVSKIMQLLFWNGSDYRSVGDVTAFSIAGLDLSKDAFEGFLAELVRQRFLSCVPFHSQTVTIRIVSMAPDMKNSRLIGQALQTAANAHGRYVLQVLELCNAAGISPLDMDVELKRYQDEKWIEYGYADETDFFRVERRIENDDQFTEAVREMTQIMARLEEEADHSFDVMFTIMTHPTAIEEFVEKEELERIEPIPRAAINTSMIKRLLSAHKRAEWTPRAVARVLHGISSPKFEASEWMRTVFWGAQGMASFKEIMRFCQQIVCNPGRIPDT